MAILRRGGVYLLKLVNKHGLVGELPFMVKSIRAAPDIGVIGGQERETMGISDWMRCSVSIEGLVSFGIEEHSGCFVTTKYLQEHAVPIEDPKRRKEALQLIGEWKELEQGL